MRLLRPAILTAQLLLALSSPALRAAENMPSAAADPAVDLRTALGWLTPGRNYDRLANGSAFGVRTAPDQWPAALKAADAWVAIAPAADKDPLGHTLPRLARLQALLLNAADPAALAKLRAERTALAALSRQLKDNPGTGEARWLLENLAQQLESASTELGEWLAETPAEHLALFTEKLAALRPVGHEKLAARYGGETKLAALLDQAREFLKLRDEVEAARKAADNKSADPAAKEAARKAMAAIGQFQGYHYDNEQLGLLIRDPDLATLLGKETRMAAAPTLEVPELLNLTNEEEAGRLLAEAFALPVPISISGNGPTAALVRKLVIAGKIIPAKMPRQLLSDWPGSPADMDNAKELVALYDTLKARFPEIANSTPAPQPNPDDLDDDEKQIPTPVIFALVAAGREAEATAFFKARGRHLNYYGKLEPKLALLVWDFLVKSSDGNPGADVWETLQALAPDAGRSQELIALTARKAENASAGSPDVTRWKLRLGTVLLAAGKIDEALAALLPIFDAGPPANNRELIEQWSEATGRLLTLARVLPRPELDGKVREKLRTEFQNPASQLWSTSLFSHYAEGELAAGRFAALETILRARLVRKPSLLGSLLRGAAGVQNEDAEDLSSHAQTYSVWIADLLARQGKDAETLKWLAESPYWEVSDLAEYGRGGEGSFRPLTLVTAASLHVVGRDNEAASILEACLMNETDSDPFHALYAAVRGQAALPFLDKLFARDRFEERPLIWKAKLLLEAGRVSEAEATIKQAIATDPSDGHQPHGDRMRAYAVAADIAEKKGDTVQAEFNRNVVAAIRRSENADDLADAGLTERAIAEYKAALGSFADAYCIQSRLGRDLAEAGRDTEAAEHFRRAFELMPDSFGRMESHCFGCESAFAGRERQRIAEEVFLALTKQTPVKPQAYYLMGYLRQEQRQWDEAADWFAKAVEADPDYINAWGRLADALAHTGRPRADLDRVAFRRLALDPYLRHGQSGLNQVRDLRGLWQAAAALPKDTLRPPEKLYPLGDKAATPTDRDRGYRRSNYDSDAAKTPDRLLAEHDVMRAITGALEMVASALRL